MALKVGFTGSRNGLTRQQSLSLGKLLETISPSEFHHGDCIGADKEVHSWVENRNIRIILHPCTISSQRAFCSNAFKSLRPKAPLIRNRDIVDSTQLLIATPDSYKEKLRSGTWSTVRYARKIGRMVKIVFPDGSILTEPEKGEGATNC